MEENIQRNVIGNNIRIKEVIPYVIAFLILLIIPIFVENKFYLRLFTEILIYGLLALSLDVLLGFTGLLSFMHNTYLGIAAYITGLFLKHISGNSMWLAFFAAILGTGLISVPVGWVQVRTGGLAFALLTIAFGMMFYTIAWKWYSVTGGDDGLVGVPQPDLTFFGIHFGSTGSCKVMYLLTLIVVALCFVITKRIMSSPFGSVLKAIRENEGRASFVGIPCQRFKLYGWTLACLLAAVSGALYIIYKGNIGPGTMSAFSGASVLMMVLLGGIGTLWGPIIGAAVFIFIHDYLSTLTEHWEIYVGLVVILLVIFMPSGFAWLIQLLSKKALREKNNG